MGDPAGGLVGGKNRFRADGGVRRCDGRRALSSLKQVLWLVDRRTGGRRLRNVDAGLDFRATVSEQATLFRPPARADGSADRLVSR